MTESSVPATMRAAFIREPGPPEAIQVGELPVPQPGPTDVLVRVRAVALDPVDALIRSGRYRTPIPFPFVIGRDLVGSVVQVGSAALPFQEGELVWCNSLGHEGRQGAFAEYAVVPADRLYRVPEGVDPEEVVAVAHPAATAYLGWFVHARLRAGETVYVGGAAGNVGMAALQMAVLAGARVIAGARDRDHARLLEAGADAAVDYRDPRLAQRLAELVRDGVDVMWNTSGHHELAAVPELVAPGGRILLTASSGPQVTLPLRALYVRDVSLLGFVLSRASVRELADAAALINRMLADRTLTTRITARLPLSEAAAVHRRMEAGEVEGRIVLFPDPG
jgi:NADPH:quinone reductase-like Zn-dependent oxidoreductase